MNTKVQHILVADDDTDDCQFFKEIVEELPVPVAFQTVTNGIELMNYLENNPSPLPNVVFLDLNMPLKNGTECLEEIKAKEHLQEVPVVIISTSMHQDIVETLYEKGANYYICKPVSYTHLRRVILEAITRITHTSIQPTRADFVIE